MHSFMTVTLGFSPPPGSPYQPVIEALGNHPQKKFYNVSKLGGAKYGNDALQLFVTGMVPTVSMHHLVL